ncbi:MAG: 2-C-methyl-D-erythritol 4-phosphate cytidylyltransferase [Planctomycetota bacterium]|nr:2-C-methyl-D-erythritol 4-phosphate cytidylyltransferase [Planctomycetota bacterium]MCX8039479.1 2-C-methyl-D-erythritol 4-phosphate cytidylyltransferase [Planctomycetota bacterium]MDW8373597.1 2-C-methyl-D-erythritol 4-phosphate cytidylyltransferase [Planctomycetota bacterium]
MAVLLLAAGGSGTRFGGSVPKQLLPLAGVPVLRRSLDAFLGLVDEVVIAAHPAHRAAIAAACAGLPLPLRIVEGGATRLASVHAALLASAGDPCLVHDAVRPLVPRRCIADCLAALAEHPAALVAVPCAATVKRVAAGLVQATVPRRELWLAQTPQGFRRAAGLEAFARAAAEGWDCTDDAEVLERAGYPVAVVPGDPLNLKITEPADWRLAEALLPLSATASATPAGPR